MSFRIFDWYHLIQNSFLFLFGLKSKISKKNRWLPLVKIKKTCIVGHRKSKPTYNIKFKRYWSGSIILKTHLVEKSKNKNHFTITVLNTKWVWVIVFLFFRRDVFKVINLLQVQINLLCGYIKSRVVARETKKNHLVWFWKNLKKTQYSLEPEFLLEILDAEMIVVNSRRN